MKNTVVKEYTEFTKMYEDAMSILCTVSDRMSPCSLLDRIKYIRNHYDKEVLNSFYNTGNLTEAAAKAIGSNVLTLKLSMDSLLKNMIEHPEIGIQEYKSIRYYLENAEYILLKNTKNLIYFKIKEHIYQFVVKSTKDGLENFVTTFHKSGIKQLQKDIKRYMQIKR